MEFINTNWAPAAGILAFFGGIALICWVEARKYLRERELSHKERLKALEMGQTLPDGEIAWANAESNRLGAVVVYGLIALTFIIGGAVGGSAIIINQAEPRLHLPVLSIIWGTSGLATFLAVLLTTIALIRPRARKPVLPTPTRAPQPEARTPGRPKVTKDDLSFELEKAE